MQKADIYVIINILSIPTSEKEKNMKSTFNKKRIFISLSVISLMAVLFLTVLTFTSCDKSHNVNLPKTPTTIDNQRLGNDGWYVDQTIDISSIKCTTKGETLIILLSGETDGTAFIGYRLKDSKGNIMIEDTVLISGGYFLNKEIRFDHLDLDETYTFELADVGIGQFGQDVIG